ncbi:MAG: site-specific integrase [Lachnospiraceae bacterium]|nr:site-specific integrase [Lachnospiraceae bacterium]
MKKNIYENDYNRYISGRRFENLYIDEIGKKDIERLFDEILKDEDIRTKAMQGIRLIIGMTFKYAFCEEMIIDNPFIRVDFSKYRDALQDTVSVSERIHTDEEMRLIRDEIARRQRLNPDYIPAYALELQILMGARRGEIPVLEWNDIHLDEEIPYIHISKEQLTAKKSEDTPKESFVITDHTKTHKDRRFPVTDEIRVFLVRLKGVHEEYGLKSRYLFPADNENGIITNNAVYNLYRRICDKLSIPISRDRMRGPHSFRRNGITDFVNSGGNLLMASKLYGNTPQVAENNYYAGLDLKNAADIIKKKDSGSRENGQ